MSKRKGEERGQTRREFTRRVALAAATPLAIGLGSAAAQPPKGDSTAAVARALSEVVRLRYGKHLTDDELAPVQRSILNGLHSAERLRKASLPDGTEPAFVFTADVH